jgi:hypothetical protein
MSAGAIIIIIIAIAATGILLMLPQAVAGEDQHRGHEPDHWAVRRLASRFGILTHVGRKSGKVDRTPINVFRASNGFIIALT